jgi:hypothetical protein
MAKKQPLERVNTFENNEHVQDEGFQFQKNLKDKSLGVVCPTCGRKAKEYKRKLTAHLCIALLEVLKYYRHNPEEISTLDYFHVNDIFKKNPILKVDFPKLQYWDLIEAKGKMVRGKFVKTYGYYRISENGIKFAQREVAVPLTAIVYNNVVKGHITNPYMTIDQVLAEVGYDYDQIAQSTNNIYQA